MPRLVQREQYRLLELKTQPEADLPPPVGTIAAAASAVISGLPRTNDDWLDITTWIKSDVLTVEDSAFEIDMLKFVVAREVDWLVDSIFRGMKVRFKGGYIAGHQEWLFDGYVANFKPLFPDDGRPRLSVMCMDDLWRLQNNRPGRITYPVVRSDTTRYTRDFHFVDEIRISEIVEGIIAEYGFEIGDITILEEHNYKFTLRNPISQGETETDYQFVQRILTGKSSGSAKASPGRNRKADQEPEVHAHALFFMETSGADNEPETKFFVQPEDVLMGEATGEGGGGGAVASAISGAADAALSAIGISGLFSRSDIQFQYNRAGGQVVDPNNYEPDSSSATLILKGVQVDENQSNSRSNEVDRVQENPRSRRGSSESGQTSDVDGAPGTTDDVANEITSPEDENDGPPGGWTAWEPDEVAIEAADRAGRFGDVVNPTEFIQNWPWERAKEFFIPKENRFESSATPMSADGDAEEATETPPDIPIPGSGRAKKRQHTARTRQWGITLKATCPNGNPRVVAKKIYAVRGLLGRYTGDWFMEKVIHTFGGRYTMGVNFGR